jgi:hypothetical protein
MAFRRAALEAIGGFDPQFHQAGDDVDVCWRLRDRGWTLGFSPAAVVWHHRRPSVRAYCRQQRGYGRAEAMLEAKWPERYNPVGQVTWSGRIYGTGSNRTYGRRARVYHGIWGTGPFQRLYEPAPGLLGVLAQTPEWHLVVAMLACATLLGALWAPLLFAALPLAIAIVAPVAYGAASVRGGGARRRTLITFLHLAGPLARLRGRQGRGLTPWRLRARGGLCLPGRTAKALWCEHWRDLPVRLASVERRLRAAGVAVRSGGEFDAWDLEVPGGLLGSARLRATIEEHGGGRQLVRLRVRPRWSPLCLAGLCLTAALAALAAVDSVWIACGVLAGAAAAIAAGSVREVAASAGALADAIPAAGDDEAPWPRR